MGVLLLRGIERNLIIEIIMATFLGTQHVSAKITLNSICKITCSNLVTCLHKFIQFSSCFLKQRKMAILIKVEASKVFEECELQIWINQIEIKQGKMRRRIEEGK